MPLPNHVLYRYGIVAGNESVLGQHDAPVKCVEWLPSRGLLASAGWDRTLRLWDPRAAPAGRAVATVALPGKAYSMSASGSRLVVAMSGRHVDIYDLRRRALSGAFEWGGEGSGGRGVGEWDGALSSSHWGALC
jgi:WD40 repeat protein